jgi:CDP-diglyceride synthetase
MTACLRSRKIYWENEVIWTISPKKTIEGFVGGLLLVIASYLVSKYYIEIAEGKIFIWIIIALIVGVLELSVI